MQNLTFIDLETPNRQNNSFCSIGIIIRQGDKEISREHYFVNPEVYFDQFNIDLHGITPEMVKDAPTFSEIWINRLASIFNSETVIVGHNIIFDLQVLAHSYRRSFNLLFPKVQYICTLALSRRIDQNKIPNHRLITCCNAYGIELSNQHNALADITATASLFDCYRNKITQKDVMIFSVPAEN